LAFAQNMVIGEINDSEDNAEVEQPNLPTWELVVQLANSVVFVFEQQRVFRAVRVV
jgi:hypothetical protein